MTGELGNDCSSRRQKKEEHDKSFGDLDGVHGS